MFMLIYANIEVAIAAFEAVNCGHFCLSLGFLIAVVWCMTTCYRCSLFHCYSTSWP